MPLFPWVLGTPSLVTLPAITAAHLGCTDGWRRTPSRAISPISEIPENRIRSGLVRLSCCIAVAAFTGTSN